ncbi:MAG TPA: hypothetical protein VL283_01920 [Candidatus Baltobacteraceae bacterium]|nr:hypothetical protein [Candidatus Baltobacteraceae bacterium]
MKQPSWTMIAFGVAALLPVTLFSCASVSVADSQATLKAAMAVRVTPVPRIDRAAYRQKARLLAHLTDDATTTADGKPLLWPVETAYPKVGALLPFNRIVAYYGNFLATTMGVLGEYPPDEMLQRLSVEVKKWEAADPSTPVVPAIDYIAVTAQARPGDDGKYRSRMPDKEIDKAVELAAKTHGIVILEVQAGLSDLQGEIERLKNYLVLPQVHLAIDPEFRMKYGQPPGTVVGTVDAADVNRAAAYLASLVRENGLPPKVLIVHRYTRAMVTHAAKIEPLPEVQIVMDMDGWGPPDRKYSTYNAYINPEPVQFTGFKLFYKNDIKREGSRLLTPEEILRLTPQPSFIQFQ